MFTQQISMIAGEGIIFFFVILYKRFISVYECKINVFFIITNRQIDKPVQNDSLTTKNIKSKVFKTGILNAKKKKFYH